MSNWAWKLYQWVWWDTDTCTTNIELGVWHPLTSLFRLYLSGWSCICRFRYFCDSALVSISKDSGSPINSKKSSPFTSWTTPHLQKKTSSLVSTWFPHFQHVLLTSVEKFVNWRSFGDKVKVVSLWKGKVEVTGHWNNLWDDIFLETSFNQTDCLQFEESFFDACKNLTRKFSPRCEHVLKGAAILISFELSLELLTISYSKYPIWSEVTFEIRTKSRSLCAERKLNTFTFQGFMTCTKIRYRYTRYITLFFNIQSDRNWILCGLGKRHTCAVWVKMGFSQFCNLSEIALLRLDLMFGPLNFFY
jgi:hypothetical protein